MVTKCDACGHHVVFRTSIHSSKCPYCINGKLRKVDTRLRPDKQEPSPNLLQALIIGLLIQIAIILGIILADWNL